MRFVINQKELEKNLDIVSTVVAKKVINPALQGTLLSIENSRLCIQSSDGEVFIKILSDLEKSKDGKILVKSHLLRDIVKTLNPNNIVDMEAVNNSVKIQTPGSKRKTLINLMPLEDVIEFPETQNAQNLISLNAMDFKSMLNKTLPFAAKEEIRFTFNSILLQKEGSDLRVVSSDTKRLAFIKSSTSEESDLSILIPSKTGQILKDMITTQDPIEISENKDGLVVFRYKNIELVSPKVEGMFPDYNAVIPKETPFVIELDKTRLLDILKGFAPFYSASETYKVFLKIQDSMMLLCTDDSDMVGADEDQLEILYKGEAVTVAFNYLFLREILQYIEESTIYMKILSPDKPVIFVGKNNESSLFVCVPMRIN